MSGPEPTTSAMDAMAEGAKLRQPSATAPSVEGRHRCASCLRVVGTEFDGREVPYVKWANGSIFCADKLACERRWAAVNEPDPWVESDPNEEAEA